MIRLKKNICHYNQITKKLDTKLYLVSVLTHEEAHQNKWNKLESFWQCTCISWYGCQISNNEIGRLHCELLYAVLYWYSEYEISKMPPLLFKIHSNQVLTCRTIFNILNVTNSRVILYQGLQSKKANSFLRETTQIPPDMEDDPEVPFLFNIKNRDFYLVPSHLGDATEPKRTDSKGRYCNYLSCIWIPACPFSKYAE